MMSLFFIDCFLSHEPTSEIILNLNNCLTPLSMSAIVLRWTHHCLDNLFRLGLQSLLDRLKFIVWISLLLTFAVCARMYQITFFSLLTSHFLVSTVSLTIVVKLKFLTYTWRFNNNLAGQFSYTLGSRVGEKQFNECVWAQASPHSGSTPHGSPCPSKPPGWSPRSPGGTQQWETSAALLTLNRAAAQHPEATHTDADAQNKHCAVSLEWLKINKTIFPQNECGVFLLSLSGLYWNTRSSRILQSTASQNSNELQR